MSFFKTIAGLRHTAEDEISSLPALVMHAEKLADNVLQGEHHQRKVGAGERFWQYREYHPQSDQPQDIDWRQSAKTDEIYVKQKEWQTTRKTFIWCAGGKSMAFTSDKSRLNKQAQAQVLSLSIALLLKRAKEQIGLYGRGQTGKSEDHLQKIAQNLFDCQNTDEYLPSTHDYDLPKHAHFIGVGDFLSPIEETKRIFDDLGARTSNAIIVQVLDPAEIFLSYSGRVRFQGLGNDPDEVINHVSSIKAAYQSRIEQHIQDMHTLCQQQNWIYILHRTDQDIADTLLNLWRITNEERVD